MWAKKRPHEWLGGVLGVLGLAHSTHISQIKQKVLKGYIKFILNRIISVSDKKIMGSSTILSDEFKNGPPVRVRLIHT
jgi:hypothetical protein